MHFQGVQMPSGKCRAWRKSKPENYIRGRQQLRSLANHTVNRNTRAFWLSQQKKSYRYEIKKRTLKIPIFVDLSPEGPSICLPDPPLAHSAVPTQASLAGNGLVSILPRGQPPSQSPGRPRVKLLIPFQEKQETERPP